MKVFSNFFKGIAGISLILACAIIVAGCTSTASPAATPVTICQTASQPATTTASLSNGITIAYPRDWVIENVNETAVRDYGRSTINIANFYSPDITSYRASLASPNVDTSKYTTLSIDVDPTPVSDFEDYFNQGTLALGTHYGHIEITKHNYQLKISSTGSSQGYKSYQMDFDTTDMRGTYVFSNVDGTIYIFAFRNPSPYSAEVQDMIKSIRIVPPQVSTEKHR
jgi:hypothetical protein